VKTINKTVLTLSLAACAGTVLGIGYDITITNEAPVPVHVTIYRAGGDLICPNDNGFNLASSEKRTVNTGLCCTSYIALNKGNEKPVYYYPPLTGFGIACRSYSFSIKQAADGTLYGVTTG
jgi:hypothetical protein